MAFASGLTAGPSVFAMSPFRPSSLLLYLFRSVSAWGKARISVKSCQHSEMPVEDRLVPPVQRRGRVLGPQGVTVAVKKLAESLIPSEGAIFRKDPDSKRKVRVVALAPWIAR